MTDQIITYIVAIAPSAAAVIAVGIAVGKIVKMINEVLRSFSELRESVKEKTEMEELKIHMESALAEVNELKKLLRKELETKTKVKQD